MHTNDGSSNVGFSVYISSNGTQILNVSLSQIVSYTNASLKISFCFSSKNKLDFSLSQIIFFFFHFTPSFPISDINVHFGFNEIGEEGINLKKDTFGVLYRPFV